MQHIDHTNITRHRSADVLVDRRLVDAQTAADVTRRATRAAVRSGAHAGRTRVAARARNAVVADRGVVRVLAAVGDAKVVRAGVGVVALRIARALGPVAAYRFLSAVRKVLHCANGRARLAAASGLSV